MGKDSEIKKVPPVFNRKDIEELIKGFIKGHKTSTKPAFLNRIAIEECFGDSIEHIDFNLSRYKSGFELFIAGYSLNLPDDFQKYSIYENLDANFNDEYYQDEKYYIEIDDVVTVDDDEKLTLIETVDRFMYAIEIFFKIANKKIWKK